MSEHIAHELERSCIRSNSKLFAATIASQVSSKMMRKLLNIDQVAQLFGVSRRTIEGWIRDGKLPKPMRRFGIRKWDSEQLEPLRKSGRGSEIDNSES